jgi:hypothetical protein
MHARVANSNSSPGQWQRQARVSVERQRGGIINGDCKEESGVFASRKVVKSYCSIFVVI